MLSVDNCKSFFPYIIRETERESEIERQTPYGRFDRLEVKLHSKTTKIEILNDDMQSSYIFNEHF